MSEIKIEKGVPIPAITILRKTKYPLGSMDVGDSFFIAGQTMSNKQGNASAYVSAKAYGVAHGKTFSGRTVEEDGVKGVRIWRLV